ncbi:FlgD immunoglobulin-like domain containing protein [Streptomyces sp. NPDC048350]|uniref:FlgD immunoglobulin-like domain containing protein n=1 Tax=Streptomyces sp. NPDC048350 TaxID=3365538 RepID=UPI00372122AA
MYGKRPLSTLLTATVLGVSGVVLGPVQPFARAVTPVESVDSAPAVVIPGASSFVPVRNGVLSAGEHGYLHFEEGIGNTWRTYGGAAKPVVVDPNATSPYGSYSLGTGSDVVADYDDEGKVVALKDVVTGETGTVALPAAHDLVGVFGWNVLTRDTTGQNLTLHVLDTRSGVLRDRTVEGTPAERFYRMETPGSLGDDDGLVLGLNGRTYWVDTTRARATSLPDQVSLSRRDSALTPDRLLYRQGSQLSVYDRADLGRAPLRMPVTDEKDSSILGLVGADLVLARHDPLNGILGGDAPSLRVEAVPLSGGTPRVLVARSTGRAVGAPDGGLLVDGGPGTADYGVYRVTADADGRARAVRDSAVASRNVVNVVRRLSFQQGRLTSLEGVAADGRKGVYTRSVTATASDLAYGARQDRGRVPTELPEGCQIDQGCPTVQEAGDGRLIYDHEGIPMHRVDEGAQLPGTAVDAGPGGVLGSSGRWTVANVFGFDGTSQSRVIDTDTGKAVRTLPGLGASLDGTTLWVHEPGSGAVIGYDVRSGELLNRVSIPNCTVTSADVVGRWLRWTCMSGGQGVYDLRTRTNTPLGIDSSTRTELGDGFLAYFSEGRIKIRELATGTVRDIGAEGASPETVWTVDPATGTIAWADAQGGIHLVGSGVVTSPPRVTDAVVPAAANLRSASWKPRWWVSKPAGSWSLTLKRKSNGAVVRTLSGGPARGVVAPVWDGRDTAGRHVANGAYTWTLTAGPADGQGAALSATGSLSVTGGVPAWRDMAGDDGFGDLLVMDTSGLVSMYRGNGTGGLAARTAGTGSKLPTTSVFVPSGDTNGDGCGDVYVRVGDQMRSYRPGCGKVLSASSPYTLIGSGWGQYDMLTSSGDANGDGRIDLIARQKATGDMYFYPGTADHRLGSRVKIGTNWKLFSKIVGAGDLNGDARGDLLGVDASGVLWRYYGTASGGVTARVKVGGGWGAYSSMVGMGDITGDGRADLVARDTSGRLWRYGNLGTGLYASRAMIGSGGWNGFKGLY